MALTIKNLLDIESNNIKIMKKIILTLIYPIWFFLGATWLGGMFMIPITLCVLPGILSLIFPSLLAETGEAAQGIGIGIGILTLITSPFIAGIFFTIGDYLKSNYEEWGYKVEMETKMI